MLKDKESGVDNVMMIMMKTMMMIATREKTNYYPISRLKDSKSNNDDHFLNPLSPLLHYLI